MTGATTNSVSGRLVALFVYLSVCLPAQPSPPAVAADFAASARHAFRNAEARHKDDPHDTNAAWQFARACFDLAEFASNNAARADLAQQGMAASQQAIENSPKSAPTHYYLGMNLGQLARTKSLGALKLVARMEREFSLARDLDEHFDHAGPDRSLGLLYRDAPVIGSIGSRSKARQHLQRAVELAPDFPENRLNLIEAYLKWGERIDAARELKTLEEQWPAARTAFADPAWTPSWADWEQRLGKLKKKIEEPTKALESPRQKE